MSSTCPVTQRRARNHSLHRLLAAHPGGGGLQHCCIHRAGGHRVYRNAPGTEFRRPNASQRIVIACHKVPIQSLSLFASVTTTSRELAVHLFSAFQGMAAVALGTNDREVVVMEAKRLKDWIGTL